MDKKKQHQTLYFKFIFVFWVVCFEQNIIYKQVSMSILAILATARVTCSVTTVIGELDATYVGKIR